MRHPASPLRRKAACLWLLALAGCSATPSDGDNGLIDAQRSLELLQAEIRQADLDLQNDFRAAAARGDCALPNGTRLPIEINPCREAIQQNADCNLLCGNADRTPEEAEQLRACETNPAWQPTLLHSYAELANIEDVVQRCDLAAAYREFDAARFERETRRPEPTSRRNDDHRIRFRRFRP